MNEDQQYSYDVALSFAGEDRIPAEALAEALFRRRVKVFYDKYEMSTLWGKDLYIHLSDLYQNKARYCVMFFSQHYVAKAWTRHELKAAQARALNENKEYILPIRLDSTEIPGILNTTVYLNWHEETPESVTDAILEKLGKVSRIPLINERTIMDWLVDETQMANGRGSVDLGDILGVKHSMRMAKDNDDWEAWYGLWFEQEFTKRLGFEPTEESVIYALEKYGEIAE
ncbi:MAG: toll/interleukin-1 receptor domain-containing protein [Ktedonobacteraceae bacterium]